MLYGDNGRGKWMDGQRLLLVDGGGEGLDLDIDGHGLAIVVGPYGVAGPHLESENMEARQGLLVHKLLNCYHRNDGVHLPRPAAHGGPYRQVHLEGSEGALELLGAHKLIINEEVHLLVIPLNGVSVLHLASVITHVDQLQVLLATQEHYNNS